MPDITYVMRINVLIDAVERTHEVGAYQAREWLESYLTYLEIQENERNAITNTDARRNSP
jgi:hypothetical protein